MPRKKAVETPAQDNETTFDKAAARFEERREWYLNRGFTRRLAIHAFCFDCAGSTVDAKNCVVKTCPLYPFRLGAESSVASKSESAKILENRKSKATKMNRGKKSK